MIDIHCHALYGVDDGAKDLEESLAMLKEAKGQGIQALVLTPHLRHGMFPYPKERILSHFETLKAKAEPLGLTLYLGCEHHASSAMVKELAEGSCLTLAGGDYVLAEFSYGDSFAAIRAKTGELMANGYLPVIAHAERCGCFQKDPEGCRELAAAGACIQLNADSILGLAGKAEEKLSRKLIKKGWGHLIASDAHGMRERACHLKECQSLVSRKYGEAAARRLFYENPKKIITGKM